MSTLIEAEGIGKYYGVHCALKDISLSVGSGEFLALVGPSGCGKTSLLKILAGFEEPSSGTLRIDGRDMLGVPPSERPTRMVFQKLALFPHKTVSQNIGFPMRIARKPRAEIASRTSEMMELMHLDPGYAERLPHELSGGEQQRVALARSMISSPSVLLLDEPLSALDAKLKKSLQAELKRLHRSLGTSFVHVTHDLEEAMMLADRICVMRAGEMLQVGRPADIYYRPQNAFVAGFIGETNLLPVTLSPRPDGTVALESRVFEAVSPSLRADQRAPGITNGAALAMIRPELLSLLEGDEPAEAVIKGDVDELFVKGSTVQYRIKVRGLEAPLVLEAPGSLRLPADVGDAVRVGFALDDLFVVEA